MDKKERILAKLFDLSPALSFFLFSTNVIKDACIWPSPAKAETSDLEFDAKTSISADVYSDVSGRRCLARRRTELS